MVWQLVRRNTALRGRVIAVVAAGTAPTQAAPELLGLKYTQVKFSDPTKPRTRPHYVIKREEENQRGAIQSVYYLPPARSVAAVCRQSGGQESA